MKPQNTLKLTFPAISINEGFARSTVAAFASQLNPTLEEIDDIKTAVSEAVTNCVVHAYADVSDGIINIECELYSDNLVVRVTDNGAGIGDVTHVMQPFVTTREADERSGMGFTVMQSFMDNLDVQSKVGKGTTIIMQKFFAKDNNKHVVNQ